jgi:hypothetical protein
VPWPPPAPTTASFTPVANSLLIAEVTVGNSTGSGLTTGAITDSLSSTWTLLKRSNISGSGCSEVWGMDAGASPAARTVTLTGTASVGQGTVLTVKVLTGAAAVASCLGASVAQGTTATSASITTTTAGSYVAGGVSHSEANVALTANDVPRDLTDRHPGCDHPGPVHCYLGELRHRTRRDPAGCAHRLRPARVHGRSPATPT